MFTRPGTSWRFPWEAVILWVLDFLMLMISPSHELGNVGAARPRGHCGHIPGLVNIQKAIENGNL